MTPAKDKTSLSVQTYNKIAKKYSEFYSSDLDSEFVSSFINVLPEKAKILDLGCGTGRLLGVFQKKGFSITGLDLSEKMLEIAKKNFPQIKFVKSDMRKTRFKNNSFDALIVAYSVIHIPKKEIPATIKEFARILKPKGKLMLVIQKGRKEKFLKEPLDENLQLFLNFMGKKEIFLQLSRRFKTLEFLERNPGKKEFPCRKLCIIAEKK